MALQIKKAVRELIWVKIALMGPSGSGKTYSSLRMATGMLNELKKEGIGQNEKILFANTEQKRGYYYANEFDYDIVDVEAPHNPEKYVELIKEAVSQGYPIIILDSSSQEWDGRGGCLDLHQQAGGTYPAWGKVTPRHDKFMTAIADSPIHVIATMRGKDQYEMEKVDNKTVVKKLGVGAKQRDGFEYEFTATFSIDQKTNLASVQKDNTHIFENRGDVTLSEEDGESLVKWANTGTGYTQPKREAKNAVPATEEGNDTLKKEIIGLCVALGGGSNETLMTMLRTFDPSGNPNKINDITKLKELLETLKTMEKENK